MCKICVVYSSVSILYETDVTYVIGKRGKKLIPTMMERDRRKDRRKYGKKRRKKKEGKWRKKRC
jgi:hypothetical protein